MQQTETSPAYTAVRPVSMAELARLYDITKYTLRLWLKPHNHKIGERIGLYYTPLQVKTIYQCLGSPESKIQEV